MIRILLVTLLLLAQAPNPDDYVGEDDPAHKGQPKSCSNSAHLVAVKRDCACQKTKPEQCRPEGNSEDKACLVYCRKPACRCSHPICETE